MNISVLSAVGADILSSMLDVEFKLIHPALKENPELRPAYKSDMAAAFDIHACLDVDEVVLRPGEEIQFGSGFAFSIRNPYIAADVLPRSGIGRSGLMLKNTTGLIDPDYQGELRCTAFNNNVFDPANPLKGNIVIKKFDRVFQLVFRPIVKVSPVYVDEFTESTQRGGGGFGSTGK